MNTVFIYKSTNKVTLKTPHGDKHVFEGCAETETIDDLYIINCLDSNGNVKVNLTLPLYRTNLIIIE